MITLVTYDITDSKTRDDLRKFLKEFGLRTQKSVFECDIDEIAIKQIREYCRVNLDFHVDSVRIYRICNSCIRKVLISGQGLKVTQLDYMVL